MARVPTSASTVRRLVQCLCIAQGSFITWYKVTPVCHYTNLCSHSWAFLTLTIHIKIVNFELMGCQMLTKQYLSKIWIQNFVSLM